MLFILFAFALHRHFVGMSAGRPSFFFYHDYLSFCWIFILIFASSGYSQLSRCQLMPTDDLIGMILLFASALWSLFWSISWSALSVFVVDGRPGGQPHSAVSSWHRRHSGSGCTSWVHLMWWCACICSWTYIFYIHVTYIFVIVRHLRRRAWRTCFYRIKYINDMWRQLMPADWPMVHGVHGVHGVQIGNK